MQRIVATLFFQQKEIITRTQEKGCGFIEI